MQRKTKIVLMGFGGVNNTGSEAKTRITIETLYEIFDSRTLDLTVFTLSVENQKRYLADFPDIKYHKIFAFNLFGAFYLYRNRNIDLLILQEGSTFIDNFSSFFLYGFCLAARTQKRKRRHVVAYVNDCGHLKPFNRRYLRDTVNVIDKIILRSDAARNRMRRYGVTREIDVTADDVFNVPRPSIEYQHQIAEQYQLSGKAVIGIAPKEFYAFPLRPRLWGRREDLFRYPFYHTWPGNAKELSARFIRQMAEFADRCVAQHGEGIVLIAMDSLDEAVCVRIREAMKHSDGVIIASSNRCLVAEMQALLCSLKILVTTRFHAYVLSSGAHVPTIALSSDSRLEDVFEGDPLSRYCLQLFDSEANEPIACDIGAWIYERYLELRQNHAAVHHDFKERAALYQERAVANKALLRSWLGDHGYPVLPEKGSQPPH